MESADALSGSLRNQAGFRDFQRNPATREAQKPSKLSNSPVKYPEHQLDLKSSSEFPPSLSEYSLAGLSISPTQTMQNEVDTLSLDISHILEECADSDISDLSQRSIADLDAEIHRLLTNDTSSSDGDGNSSEASLSSIQLEQGAALKASQSSRFSEQANSTALHIFRGLEEDGEDNYLSSQSVPSIHSTEEELVNDHKPITVHSRTLGASTDDIVIDLRGEGIGKQTRVASRYTSTDSDEVEDEGEGSREIAPRPLADELEEAQKPSNKPAEQRSNESISSGSRTGHLNLKMLARTDSDASDAGSASEGNLSPSITSSSITEDEVGSENENKEVQPVETGIDDATNLHKEIPAAESGQLSLEMLAVTDSEITIATSDEEAQRSTESNDVGQHASHTTEIEEPKVPEGSTGADFSLDLADIEMSEGSHSHGRIPISGLTLEMLAATDSEAATEVTSDEESPTDGWKRSAEKEFQNAVVRGDEILEGNIKQEVRSTNAVDLELSLEMLAVTDSEMSRASSESDEEFPAPLASPQMMMKLLQTSSTQQNPESTKTSEALPTGTNRELTLEMLAVSGSESTLRSDTPSEKGEEETTLVNAVTEKENQEHPHSGEPGEAMPETTPHQQVDRETIGAGVTLEMFAASGSGSSPTDVSGEDAESEKESCLERLLPHDHLLEKLMQVDSHDVQSPTKVSTSSAGAKNEMISSDIDENTQQFSNKDEEEFLDSHLHEHHQSHGSASKEVQQNFISQTEETDFARLLTAESLPITIRECHETPNHTLRLEDADPWDKIAELEENQKRMEELFQQERTALWTVINKQAQIVRKLHAARAVEQKKTRRYCRRVQQKLQTVESGILAVGREHASLEYKMTSFESRHSSQDRRIYEEDVPHIAQGRGKLALLSEQKVTKLKKFFGDNPPLLEEFLKRLGYEQYIPKFLNEKIGLLELPHITERQLIRLGIPMGPRLRIMHEAQLL